jgi:hypothetical protein
MLNSQYAVSLVAPEGRLHMQFVSVEGATVLLWGEMAGAT